VERGQPPLSKASDGWHSRLYTSRSSRHIPIVCFGDVAVFLLFLCCLRVLCVWVARLEGAVLFILPPSSFFL
jgi:hypothetical protein